MDAESRRRPIGTGIVALLMAVLGWAGPTARVVASGADPAGAVVQQRYVEGELLLRVRTRIPVEASVAWDAWTRADQLVQWFPHEAEMTVAEGGEYRWSWEGQQDVWQGTFVEVDRPQVLTFTWNPPESFFPEGSYETTVRLTFEEAEGETLLTLEHSGFRDTADMEATYGRWEEYLYNLRAYLLRR